MFRIFADFLTFFGPRGRLGGHPGAGGFHVTKFGPMATLPDPVRGRNRVFGAFRDFSISYIGDAETPVAVAHIDRPHGAVAQQQQPLCGYRTLLCGYHTLPLCVAKSGVTVLHPRTQDRFPALRGDKRKMRFAQRVGRYLSLIHI